MDKVNKPSKLLFIDKHIDSKRLAKEKSYHLVREDGVNKSEIRGMEFVNEAKKRDIKIQYDITYGGHPHELSYTEFFGSLGGIYVKPCCGKMIKFMLSHDYDTSNNVDFADYIKERSDKYIMHHYPIEPMDCSVILSGSNLLRKQIIKKKLNAAADLGAKIKPHPLTSQQDMDLLESEFKDNLVPRMYSGFNVMQASRYIFSSGASELGLYAMLLGKHVIDISNDYPGGGYFDIFKLAVVAENQKEKLNWLLNHPGLGVIMPENEDGIVKFLDYYQEKYREFEKANK